MITTKPPTLDVGKYDPFSDTIMIEGTKYAGDMFRALGINAMIGDVLRIDKHENNVITVTRLNNGI